MMTDCFVFLLVKFVYAILYFITDLIQATQESNVNIPQMADTLFERAGNASWIVVFKALVATHHLMVHGNEVRCNLLFALQKQVFDNCWIIYTILLS